VARSDLGLSLVVGLVDWNMNVGLFDSSVQRATVQRPGGRMSFRRRSILGIGVELHAAVDALGAFAVGPILECND
jgi:hypothetical protein